MNRDRRDFLKTSLVAGGALGMGAFSSRAAAGPVRQHGVEKADQPLDILILGGTGFIGPPMVEYALERGHKVTLFNRGRTNTDLFPNVEKLVGDRSDNLAALEGRTWDVVFDNHASVPRWVRQSADLLKDSAKLYVYTSSLSAYSDSSTLDQDETGALFELPADHDPANEEITGETYGPFKVLCERAAMEAFKDRCLVVRPTLIIGPGDPSDRWTYWATRIHDGGEVMVPGDGNDPVQYIDARDMTAWMVRMAEDMETGYYNGLGPRSPIRMDEMVHGIRGAIPNLDIEFTWVDAEFLEEQEVRAWGEMTAWIPATDEYAGFSTFLNDKAIAKGLKFRSLAEITMDILKWWYQELDDERRASPRAGLAREREVEVLAAWHARE